MVGSWGDVASSGMPHKGVSKFSKGGGKPPRKGGCGKKAAAFVIWGSVSGWALVNAIAQSLG